jgi:hypothetical protein
VLARDPSGLRKLSVSTRVLESSNSNWLAVAEADAHAAVRSGCELVSNPKGNALDCRNRLPSPLDCDSAAERADRAGGYICAHACGASVSRTRSKAAEVTICIIILDIFKDCFTRPSNHESRPYRMDPLARSETVNSRIRCLDDRILHYSSQTGKLDGACEWMTRRFGISPIGFVL